MIIASKFIEKIINLESHLQKSFSIKSIEDIDYVHGLKVKRNREQRTLKLSQDTYTKTILERFKITNCCLIACPIAPRASPEVQKEPVVDFPYLQAVSSVMYLAMGTRLNLEFSVKLVLPFASNLGKVHVKVVKVSCNANGQQLTST